MWTQEDRRLKKSMVAGKKNKRSPSEKTKNEKYGDQPLGALTWRGKSAIRRDKQRGQLNMKPFI